MPNLVGPPVKLDPYIESVRDMTNDWMDKKLLNRVQLMTILITVLAQLVAGVPGRAARGALIQEVMNVLCERVGRVLKFMHEKGSPPDSA